LSLPAPCVAFIATLANRETTRGKRPVGRPSRLVPGVAERLFTALCLGVPDSVSARYAGLAPATFYDWKARGRRGERAEFVRFLEACEACDAAAQVALVTLVRRAAATEWRAAMALLGARWPKRYGRREPAAPVATTIRFERDDHAAAGAFTLEIPRPKLSLPPGRRDDGDAGYDL
jgi:hypothetical protein